MSEVTAVDDPNALTGEQVGFVADLLSANARWSASIHTAALDGQERASNEWAARYLRLVQRIGLLLEEVPLDETETLLFDRLAIILDGQGHYPHSAQDQLDRYRERLERDKSAAGE